MIRAELTSDEQARVLQAVRHEPLSQRHGHDPECSCPSPKMAKGTRYVDLYVEHPARLHERFMALKTRRGAEIMATYELPDGWWAVIYRNWY